MKNVQQLIDQYYPFESHPYRIFERRVKGLLGDSTAVMDAGCGRAAERLRRLAPAGVGVDLVDFRIDDLRLVNADLARVPLPDASFDLIYSVSVIEHLEDPQAVLREMHRLLRVGGIFIFLTPNLWDYGSLASLLIPNRFHAALVRRTEGRAEEDTFPTSYRCNTRSAILRHARGAGFVVSRIEYLSQYPNYLRFNPWLFRVGMIYERFTRLSAFRALRGWLMAELQKDEMSF